MAYRDYSNNGSTLRILYNYSQSVSGNYTDVTITDIQFCAGTVYGWYYGDGTVTINGNTLTFTNSAADGAVNCINAGTGQFYSVSHSATLPSFRIYHNASGAGSFSIVFGKRSYNNFNMLCARNSSYGFVLTNGYTDAVTLPTIDRAGPSISASVTDLLPTGFKISASANLNCDTWQYSIDNGSTWQSMPSSTTSSATVTVTGLSENTTYYVRVRARKPSNGVTGYSSTITVKTPSSSVLSSVSTVTADASPAKISFSAAVKDTAFSHTLDIYNGDTRILSLTGLSLANGDNSITLTAAQRTTLLAAMASIKTFTGRFVLTTYSGGSAVGSPSEKTASVETTAANSSPSFPGFTYYDNNAATVAITGDNQTLIQNASLLKVLCSAATARNGASISGYSVTAGSTTQTSTTTEIDAGAVKEAGTVLVIVTAIDSRGYTASASVSVTVIGYERVQINTATLRRRNEVEAVTQVSISGYFSSLIIGGSEKNSLKALKYRYKLTSADAWGEWVDITSQTTITAYGFSFAVNEWLSLDTDYSYYFEFVAVDVLTEDSEILTVAQGTPLMSFRRKMVGINNRSPAAALDVGGAIRMNGAYVLGYIATIGEESFNSLTAGGVYIFVGGDNYAAPVTSPGVLEVIAEAGSNVLQRFTLLALPHTVFIRAYTAGVWTDWAQH